jgi:hypothetical protein
MSKEHVFQYIDDDGRRIGWRLELEVSSRQYFEIRHYFKPVHTYIFWLVFPLITIAGITGNMLVIIAVLSCRKMRASAMNILMTNLAFADLGNLIAGSSDWMQILIYR